MTATDGILRLPPPDEDGPAGDATAPLHSIEAPMGARGAGIGPGVRCVVVLNGCPLRCASCAASASGDVKGSPAGGFPVEAGALAARIRSFTGYMQVSGGGVTVTGAEPLHHVRFVRDLFARCRELGIATALDTTAAVNPFAAIGLLDLTDLVVLDITGLDADEPGRAVPHFARRVAAAAKPLWLRFAVLPGITDDPGRVAALADFAAALPAVEKVEIVGFDRLPGSDLRRSCPVPALRDAPAADGRHLRPVRQAFLRRGLRAE